MGNALLILGNGFDLGHGLNTRYMDFIIFLKAIRNNECHISEMKIKDNIMNNQFVTFFIDYPGTIDGWIDFESVLKILIYKIEDIIKDFFLPAGNKRKNITFNFSNDQIMEHICRSFYKIIKVDYNSSVTFENRYMHDFYIINKEDIKKNIISEFDIFIKLFAFYLDIEMSKKNILPLKLISEIDVGKIITFNYTNTYTLYHFNCNVVHVHGSCKSNTIVLGYDDEKVNELEFVYFKKYFQILKNNLPIFDCSDFTLSNTVEEKGYVFPKEIHFYGHSLDITDEDKIRLILGRSFSIDGINYENTVKYYFYYFGDNDRLNKIKNLIILIGKNEVINSIKTKRFQFIEINHQ